MTVLQLLIMGIYLIGIPALFYLIYDTLRMFSAAADRHNAKVKRNTQRIAAAVNAAERSRIDDIIAEMTNYKI